MADLERESTTAASLTQAMRSVVGFSKATGPGLFMFRSLIVGISASIVTGLSCSVLGAWAFSLGGLGYVAGSSIGFAVGMFHYYTTSVQRALLALEQNPRLMMHHVLENYPLRFRAASLGANLERRPGQEYSLGMKDALSVAWQTASVSLDEIATRKEAALVLELSQDDTEPLSLGDSET